jgi:hypothetical protein
LCCTVVYYLTITITIIMSSSNNDHDEVDVVLLSGTATAVAMTSSDNCISDSLDPTLSELQDYANVIVAAKQSSPISRDKQQQEQTANVCHQQKDEIGDHTNQSATCTSTGFALFRNNDTASSSLPLGLTDCDEDEEGEGDAHGTHTNNNDADADVLLTEDGFGNDNDGTAKKSSSSLFRAPGHSEKQDGHNQFSHEQEYSLGLSETAPEDNSQLFGKQASYNLDQADADLHPLSTNLNSSSVEDKAAAALPTITRNPSQSCSQKRLMTCGSAEGTGTALATAVTATATGTRNGTSTAEADMMIFTGDTEAFSSFAGTETQNTTTQNTTNVLLTLTASACHSPTKSANSSPSPAKSPLSMALSHAEDSEEMDYLDSALFLEATAPLLAANNTSSPMPMLAPKRLEASLGNLMEETHTHLEKHVAAEAHEGQLSLTSGKMDMDHPTPTGKLSVVNEYGTAGSPSLAVNGIDTDTTKNNGVDKDSTGSMRDVANVDATRDTSREDPSSSNITMATSKEQPQVTSTKDNGATSTQITSPESNIVDEKQSQTSASSTHTHGENAAEPSISGNGNAGSSLIARNVVTPATIKKQVALVVPATEAAIPNSAPIRKEAQPSDAEGLQEESTSTRLDTEEHSEEHTETDEETPTQVMSEHEQEHAHEPMSSFGGTRTTMDTTPTAPAPATATLPKHSVATTSTASTTCSLVCLTSSSQNNDFYGNVNGHGDETHKNVDQESRSELTPKHNMAPPCSGNGNQLVAAAITTTTPMGADRRGTREKVASVPKPNVDDDSTWLTAHSSSKSLKMTPKLVLSLGTKPKKKRVAEPAPESPSDEEFEFDGSTISNNDKQQHPDADADADSKMLTLEDTQEDTFPADVDRARARTPLSRLKRGVKFDEHIHYQGDTTATPHATSKRPDESLPSSSTRQQQPFVLEEEEEEDDASTSSADEEATNTEESSSSLPFSMTQEEEAMLVRRDEQRARLTQQQAALKSMKHHNSELERVFQIKEVKELRQENILCQEELATLQGLVKQLTTDNATHKSEHAKWKRKCQWAMDENHGLLEELETLKELKEQQARRIGIVGLSTSTMAVHKTSPHSKSKSKSKQSKPTKRSVVDNIVVASAKPAPKKSPSLHETVSAPKTKKKKADTPPISITEATLKKSSLSQARAKYNMDTDTATVDGDEEQDQKEDKPQVDVSNFEVRDNKVRAGQDSPAVYPINEHRLTHCLLCLFLFFSRVCRRRGLR